MFEVIPERSGFQREILIDLKTGSQFSPSIRKQGVYRRVTGALKYCRRQPKRLERSTKDAPWRLLGFAYPQTSPLASGPARPKLPVSVGGCVIVRWRYRGWLLEESQSLVQIFIGHERKRTLALDGGILRHGSSVLLGAADSLLWNTDALSDGPLSVRFSGRPPFGNRVFEPP